MRVDVDLDIGRKTFASGLLPELIAVLRRSHPGDLVAVVGDEEGVGIELETWCRFTGNPLLETTVENGRARFIFRCGPTPVPEDNRPVGSRLWLYANFDCNLHCDYCCVRSSPTVPRRELGLARVQQIAREAPALGVKEIFVTGGEPFLLENIGEILACCAAAAPTTVLTNGILFAGRRAESLAALPRDRIVLQISLDSATPELHDLHRGRGSWARAREGIQRARAQGFRVRLAATVSTDTEAEQFRQSYAGSLCAVLQPKVSPLAEPISCRKLRLPLRVCTGIQSERRMPICLSRARFSPCPKRSLRFAAPSTISWQESLTAHECIPSDQQISGWLSPVHLITQADLANNWLKNPC